MTEAALTGLRPEDVIGKNFFLDVAKCIQTPEIYGKFREHVDAGWVNIQFDYIMVCSVIAATLKRLRPQDTSLLDAEKNQRRFPATGRAARFRFARIGRIGCIGCIGCIRHCDCRSVQLV